MSAPWVFFVSFYKPKKASDCYDGLFNEELSLLWCFEFKWDYSLLKIKRGFWVLPSIVSVQIRDSKSSALSMLGVDFMGKPLPVSDQKDLRDRSLKFRSNFPSLGLKAWVVEQGEIWPWLSPTGTGSRWSRGGKWAELWDSSHERMKACWLWWLGNRSLYFSMFNAVCWVH